MLLKDIFAKRVRTLRLKIDIKQSELGEIIGLSSKAISDIERGYRFTTMDKLAILADYFDVSIDYLMGRSNNPR